MDAYDASIMLSSEDQDGLRAFYRDIVALPPRPEYGPNAFSFGKAVLNISEHSETKGATKEPHRVILNLFVDDLDAQQERLRAAGVRFVRDRGREEWGGIISTFADPDGNFVQLIQVPAEYR
jgi:predicted enzyme related to lactoylglutathione lyase